MKKLLLLGLALMLLGSAMFADDAKVMPLHTGRLSLAPSFTFGQKAFDGDGSREDTDAALKMLNFGAALEFGIISWITGAIQWAPGINMWSDVDMEVPNPDYSPLGPDTRENSDSDVRLLQMGDLFLGAKVQIFGTDAPIKSDMIRLAFAPGVKLPLQITKYDEQYDNAKNGDKVTGANIDNHVFGYGLRSYFDFIINDKFFINFYNEFLHYPIKGDLEKTGYTEYALMKGMDGLNAQANKLAAANLPVEAPFKYSKDVDYGYDLTFELEPVFSTRIAKGLLFTASMPITYKTTPGKKYDISYDADKAAAVAGALSNLELMGLAPANSGIAYKGGADKIAANVEQLESGQTHMLTVNPGVAIMFYEWMIPFEFELNYKAPLWGMEQKANHTIVFIAKMFFKI